jgi:5-methylcytosine-specific restriction endonuclease McrA
MSRKDLEIYETKIAVFTRDGWRCQYCGAGGHLQLAHRVPQTKANLRKYGVHVIHHPDNLTTTCPRCNDRALVGQDKALESEIIAGIEAKLQEESYNGLPI